MKKTTRFAGGFLHITNSCNLGSGVDAVRGDLYKGKETFPHCQSLALRERWHFACEMTERVRHRRCRRFLVVAGVSASRAAKKALLGLFARRDASAVPQLFESTREGVTLGFCKRKRPAYFLRRSFLVGAGVSASRAAKKAPLGLFCPAGRKRRAAAVRIHPRGCDFGFLQRKRPAYFYAGLFGGAKQPKSEPLPSGASLAAISSNVMVFVPSL